MSRDDKTPVVEASAPFTEKLTPAPQLGDFQEPERDIYSEECSELLDRLGELEEEDEEEPKPPTPPEKSSLPKVTSVIPKANVIFLEEGDRVGLPPLELNTELYDLSKNLSTPGKCNL